MQPRQMLNLGLVSMSLLANSGFSNLKNYDTQLQFIQSDGCYEDSIWNGKNCIPISYQGETKIIGYDDPISSIDELIEIEQSFVKRAFPDISDDLLWPDDKDEAFNIQIWRSEKKLKGPEVIRDWEFIISTDSIKTVREKYGIDDIMNLLVKHADAASDIWSASIPSIDTKARVDRIIIVDSEITENMDYYHSVPNDTKFAFWANDIIGNKQTIIPFDIDSRWVLDTNWTSGLHWQYHKGVLIDFAISHENTHHLPVGDNYVYNPKEINGFKVRFMINDHMSRNTAKKLTAPSTYAILYFWKENPLLRLAPQSHEPFDINYIYGRSFFNNFTIKLEGLPNSVKGCSIFTESQFAYREQYFKGKYRTRPREKVEFNEDCSVEMDYLQQYNNFPGLTIGLRKGKVVLPIFIPRILFETLFWKEGLKDSYPPNYEFTLEFNNHFNEVFEQYLQDPEQYRENSKISLYFDQNPINEENVIALGSIDDLGNKYFIEVQ